jgi:gas vesicle protein
MDTASEVLLIIVSSILAIFLIILIAAIVYVLKILRQVKRITERAETVAGSVEAAATAFGKTATPLTVLRIIGTIVSQANKSRKGKGYSMSDKRSETVKKVAIGSAIAGAVGYLAGILSAPKSGKQTRQDIADKAGEVKTSAEDELQDLNEELKDLIKDAKGKTISLGSAARAEYNETLIKAKDAQNKAGEVLRAVKNGEAANPELDKAVRQAKQAAKNLGKYLKS